MTFAAAPAAGKRVVLALAGAGLLLAGMLHMGPPLVATARAGEPDAFTIPGDDGYGIGECMRPGNECGRIMADAWCQAHGHGKAIAFGSADDVTGSIQTIKHTTEPSSSDVIIRCGH